MPMIPYSPVPTTSPSVRGISPQHVDVSPDMFGAQIGNAMKSAGSNFLDASNTIMDYQLKMANQANEAGSYDLSAQSAIRAGTIRSDYLSQQGANAMGDAYEKYKQDIIKNRDDTLTAATNPAQRAMLERIINRQFSLDMTTGAAHVASETKQYNKQSREAIISTQTADAASAGSYDEWTKRAELLSQTTAATMREFSGAPQEAIDRISMASRAKSFSGWAENLALTNPKGAYDAYLKEHDALVKASPDLAFALGNKLRSQVSQHATGTLAADAAKGNVLTAPHWGAPAAGRVDFSAPRPGGKMTPDQVFKLASDEVTRQGLVGYVPIDGPKYGIKTGSAAEWGRLFTWISAAESSHNNGDSFKEPGMYDSSGRQVYSRGLYALSEQDGPTYKLNNGQRFTQEQLADPNINTAIAVTIAHNLVKEGGSIAGMMRYWSTLRDGKAAALLGKGWGGELTGADYAGGNPMPQRVGNSLARQTSTGTSFEQSFQAAMAANEAKIPLYLTQGHQLPALTPGMAESQFLANRADFEQYLREVAFRGPNQDDLVDKTLRNYDGQYQRMQGQYVKEQKEITDRLHQIVAGIDPKNPDGKPLITLQELQNNPEANSLYSKAAPETQSKVLDLLHRLQKADDKEMDDDEFKRYSSLRAKILQGQFVDANEVNDAGLPRKETRQLLLSLDSKGTDAVTSTKMFQDFFPNFMMNTFGIRKGSEPYNILFSNVHDALEQNRQQTGRQGQSMAPDDMQFVTKQRISELARQYPELFDTVKASNIAISPEVKKLLPKDKEAQATAISGLQQAGAMLAQARRLPDGMRHEMQQGLINTQISVPGKWYGTNDVPLANAYANNPDGSKGVFAAAGLQPGTAMAIIKYWKAQPNTRGNPSVEDILQIYRTQPAFGAKYNQTLFKGMNNGQ